jgi:hypothetical protein
MASLGTSQLILGAVQGQFKELRSEVNAEIARR